MRTILRRKKIILFVVLVVLILVQNLLVKNGNSSTSPKETRPTPIISHEIIPSEELLEDDEIGDESGLGYDTEISNSNREHARVVGIRDGDTIEVDFGGGIKRTVRYIGIDTPESVDPRRPLQCFGEEASGMNNTLVMNKVIQMEKDVSETDRYGRLLRYVYVDGIFVNEYLVAQGFAHASAYPPDVTYQEELDIAEMNARLTNKGLWGTCSSDRASAGNSTSQSGDKDCSDFETHQEAQDYFNAKGGSSTNNVDRLDGADHDGIVCETLP